MAQYVFNAVISAYAVATSIVIGNIIKQIKVLHDTDNLQINFNEEVIKGFKATRERLEK